MLDFYSAQRDSFHAYGDVSDSLARERADVDPTNPPYSWEAIRKQYVEDYAIYINAKKWVKK